MITHKVVFAAFLGAALGAGAVGWFDAGIAGYTEWPSDGSDVPVAGAGTWSGTANASLVRADGQPSRLQIVTEGFADALAFGPDVAKALDANPVFRLTVNFCLFFDLPPVEPSVKTALTALDKGNGQYAYYGLVADEDGGTNRWAELAGAVPWDGVDVDLEVFVWFALDAIDGFDDDGWLRDFELKAFAAHILDQDAEMKFATAGNGPSFAIRDSLEAEGDVSLGLLI